MKQTIDIDFKYKGKSHIINSNTSSKFQEICETFAKNNSLDIDFLLFIYEGVEINLKIDLYVGEQFSKEAKSKKKKKAEVFVFNKYPFQVKFVCTQCTLIVSGKETDKMSTFLTKFSSEMNMDIKKLLFLYGGEPLNYLDDKAAIEYMNENDKSEKVMSISVNDEYRNSISVSPSFLSILNGEIKIIYDDNNDNDNDNENEIINDDDNDNNDDNELLIGNHNNIIIRVDNFQPLEHVDPLISEKKNLYFKNSLIICIQYAIILLICSLGFVLEFNKVISDNINITLVISLFSIILFFIFMSMIFSGCIKDYMNSKYLIIFHIYFPIITIYLGFFLSSYIDYKYIIIGFSLIFIELLSLGIHVMIFKNFRLLYLSISSSVLSLIGYILFLFFWLKVHDYTNYGKSFLPILYLSIFYVFTNAYYALWLYVLSKKTEMQKYFFSAFIFNYGLPLLSAYLVILPFKYICYLVDKFYKDERVKKDARLSVFLSLIKQYIIIMAIVLVGIYLDLHQVFKHNNFFGYLMGCIYLFLIIYVIIICNISYENYKYINYFMIIIYIPIIALIFYAFASFTAEKYIICFLILGFIDIASIILVMFFCQAKKVLIFSITCILVYIPFILIFHFFWLKESSSTIALTFINLAFIIYLVVEYHSLRKGFEIDKPDIDCLVVGFNYTIFLPCYTLTYLCERCDRKCPKLR